MTPCACHPNASPGDISAEVKVLSDLLPGFYFVFCDLHFQPPLEVHTCKPVPCFIPLREPASFGKESMSQTVFVVLWGLPACQAPE
jgi:hypothetical protein